MPTDLKTIPGAGPNRERHLRGIGIACVEDLVGADSEALYERIA